MRCKVIGVLTACALAASPANAQLFQNLKWEGRFDFSALSADNVTDFSTGGNSATPATINRDRISTMQNRIMIGLSYTLLENVRARTLVRKNNRVYGNNSEHLHAISENVFVDEANLTLQKLPGAIDLTFGRQFWGEPGELIAFFGPRYDYGLTVTALDSVRADWSGERLGATFILGKLSSNTGTLAPASQNNSVDVRGLLLTGGGEKNRLTGYLWNSITRRYAAGTGAPPSTANAGGSNSRLYIAGLKGKAVFGPAWASFEAAKNFGDQRQTESATLAGSRKFDGWGVLADLGGKWTAGPVLLEPWGQFAFGSGDADAKSNRNTSFQTIATDYRPGAIYGRFWTGAAQTLGSAAVLANGSDEAANGLTNRIIWGAGLKLTPTSAPKASLAASVWDFRHHRATAGGTNPQQNRGARHIGTEYDLVFAWTQSDNILLTLTAASFQPGSVIRNAADMAAGGGQGVSPVTLAAFDARVRWGGQ
jgi:hypothetical protein